MIVDFRHWGSARNIVFVSLFISVANSTEPTVEVCCSRNSFDPRIPLGGCDAIDVYLFLE